MALVFMYILAYNFVVKFVENFVETSIFNIRF